jgi:hypothetical protein
MSKRINVNPGQYKVAGRERQGENVIHSAERRTLARLRRQERLIHPVSSKEANQPMAGSKSTRSTAAPRGSKAQTAATRLKRTGISNRESPDTEARERREHPPIRTSSPPPEDAAGRVGEEPLDDRRNRHTSHKAGSRSIAQKEAEARYPDRSMPAARKVAGAFGREPQRVPATSNESSGAVRRAQPKRAAKGKRKTR